MREEIESKIKNFLTKGDPGEFIITIKPNGDVLCEKKESYLFKKNK